MFLKSSYCQIFLHLSVSRSSTNLCVFVSVIFLIFEIIPPVRPFVICFVSDPDHLIWIRSQAFAEFGSNPDPDRKFVPEKFFGKKNIMIQKFNIILFDPWKGCSGLRGRLKTSRELFKHKISDIRSGSTDPVEPVRIVPWLFVSPHITYLHLVPC